ncbi:protein PLASTID REDOX INSENSITIVE 2, chloroplastic isoform X1 [Elaeis guineensis]|uniref:Protein PLASTID REDOX INSENSITIVE 2, chloroplastic n=1 Tax=Elaeis guineensis var. tenera TaxID=51953 RepID=A0A6I9QSL3_ELAGV|nr:protein PLASTID REDOX INSENSITIVE 2, chloroplastic [Elaeis guineensis]
MACFNAPASLSPLLPSLPHHLPSSSLLFTRRRLSSTPPLPSRFHRSFPLISPSLPPFSSLPHSIQLLCRAAEYAEYKFPDPIPEFAEAETSKFRIHMLQRLTKKNEYFGDHVEEIVGICTEILSNFLHTEYGGPGTLLVIPFIDMADTIREKGLPGAPQAARAAVVWAQKHIDNDWKEWTRDSDSD